MSASTFLELPKDSFLIECSHSVIFILVNLSCGKCDGCNACSDKCNACATYCDGGCSSKTCGACSSSCSAVSENEITVSDGYTLKYKVNEADATISMEVTYDGEAWVGIAFSEDARMGGSDGIM